MTKISERSIRFRTPYNYDHEAERKETNIVVLDPETGELGPMPSCTVPDQTVSIKEIVDRTRKGQIVTGALKAVYNPQDTMPDPKSMDFVERKLAIEQADRELAEIAERDRQRKAAKQAKKQKAKEDWEAFQSYVKKSKEGEKPDVGTNIP